MLFSTFLLYVYIKRSLTSSIESLYNKTNNLLLKLRREELRLRLLNRLRSSSTYGTLEILDTCNDHQYKESNNWIELVGVKMRKLKEQIVENKMKPMLRKTTKHLSGKDKKNINRCKKENSLPATHEGILGE